MNVIDRTLERHSTRLRTTDGLLAALSALVGESVKLPCLRGEAAGCKSNSEGPCRHCVSLAALETLLRSESAWSVARVNQALLLTEQAPLSEDFYVSFFGSGDVDDQGFLDGITQFRAYAMLAAGGIRYAFKRLATAPADEIRGILRRWAVDPEDRRRHFTARPHGVTLVRPIADRKRWYLGYLSKGKLESDLDTALALNKQAKKAPLTDREKTLVGALTPEETELWTKLLPAVEKKLLTFQDELTATRAIGLANTSAYLAANHIDVYVATSMREDWEFRAVARFLAHAFADKAITDLGDVTYFDPTLSYNADRIDKGLVEGLMLRNARCTIYMVQEADTLGKDSELAATLAQGGVVIAYVPEKVTPEQFDSIDYVRKRALALLAEERFQPDKAGRAYDLLSALVKLPTTFKLLRAQDVGGPTEAGLPSDAELTELRTATAEAEAISLNSRARTLRDSHPLALQLELDTGVANGVLVTRTPEHCAALVAAALTNTLEFEIVDSPTQTDGGPSATLLLERTTQCPFRVVTNHEMLTNSFWTQYWRG